MFWCKISTLQKVCYSLIRLLCRKSGWTMVYRYSTVLDYSLLNGSPRDGHYSSAALSLHTDDRKHFICLVEFRKTNRGRAVVAKAATSGDMAPWRVLCDGQWRVSVCTQISPPAVVVSHSDGHLSEKPQLDRRKLCFVTKLLYQHFSFLCV